MKKLLVILLLAATALAATTNTKTLTAMYMYATHSVLLSWIASTDATTAAPGAYNVYRATTTTDCTAAGAPVKLTATPITSLTFSDGTVTPGQQLCYTITFVLNGLESAPSNSALARILPAPPVQNPPVVN